MNILILTELYPPNCRGGGWSTYNLAKALNEEEGIEVKVLAINQEEVREDVPVEKLEITRFPNEIAYREIIEEINDRKKDYDIIQGQHSLTIPPLGKIDDKPTVGVIRDYWPVCYRTTLRDRFGNNHKKCGAKCIASTVMDFHIFATYKFFNHFYRQKLAKKVDVLSARSQFVEERLVEHGFQNTDVKYNFVPENFAVNVEAKGEGDILFVGNVVKQKGPHLLVEAIPEILEQRPDQNFVFLGEGELIGNLQERAEELGVSDNVEFKGHVPMSEVKSRMKGARAVVSTSLWYEPLSRVVLESQALDTPVITTKRGGNSEVVDDSKVIDMENKVESLAGILKGEIDVDHETITADQIISEWKDLYQNLLKDRR